MGVPNCSCSARLLVFVSDARMYRVAVDELIDADSASTSCSDVTFAFTTPSRILTVLALLLLAHAVCFPQFIISWRAEPSLAGSPRRQSLPPHASELELDRGLWL